MKAIVLGLFLAVSTHSWGLGLASGNHFETISMKGRVVVHCSENNQRDTAYYNCGAVALSPVEFDYIVSSGLNADKVTVNYTDSRGKDRSKSVNFDANKQRSTKRVNLWIGTLLQRPLLHSGDNQLEFVATKNGQVVRRENTTVSVVRGEDRQCLSRTYFSRALQDCRNSSFICQKYFQDENYCD